MAKLHVKKKTRVVSVSTRLVGLNSNSSKENPVSRLFSKSGVFRICLIEVPALVLFALALVCHILLYIQETYVHDYLEALQFSGARQELEQTFPRMECTVQDLTALEPGPLFIRENESYLDATEKVLLHGAAVFPSLLSNQMASNLRKYALQRAKRLNDEDQVLVIMKKNRQSFTLSATEHPSVALALQEVGTNPLLVQTLEALLGPDPSLMELQIIISKEGAEPQYFHADTPPASSASMNQHTFVPLYSLLIPLQDTTPEMGATAVCPGSHRCYYTESCTGFGADYGDNTTRQVGFFVTDPSIGFWKAGYGLLYSSSTTHRGTGHTKGPERAVFILSFAGRPDSSPDYRPSRFTRFPPVDSVYAIRWHHLGQSLSDLRDPYNLMSFSWTRWTGLFRKNSKRSWTSYPFDFFRAAHPDVYRFRQSDLKEQKKRSKGLMGTLSAIFFVDVEPIQIDEGEPYISETEDHARRLLERIRTVFLYVSAFLLCSYMAVVANTSQSCFMWTVGRIILLSTLFYGLAAWFKVQVVDQSGFAQDISRGDIAVIPSESSHLRYLKTIWTSEDYTETLPTPGPQDVLVDDTIHRSAKKLAAQTHLLEYLPGNRRWREFSEEQVVYFLRYAKLPWVFRNAVVDRVISLTRTESGYNFYEKNLLGDYVEISHDSLQQRTRKLFLEKVLYPERRLGSLTDKFHCRGFRTLCIMRPQVIRHIFGDSVDPTSLKRVKPRQLQLSTPLLVGSSLATKMPTKQSNKTCDYGQPSSDNIIWNLGDVVQFQFDRPGLYPSRKWVNAVIVAMSPSEDLYDLKAFNVEEEFAFRVPGSSLRKPAKRSPEFKTLSTCAVQTKAGPFSVTSCPMIPGFFHLSRDTGCFPEMARAYNIPNDTINVEILFEFYELESSKGGANIFIRLADSDLELGHFDPNVVERFDPVSYDNALVTVQSLNKIHNKVGLVVPDRWFSTSDTGSKTLIFGVIVLGVDVGIHIGNIRVFSLSNDGHATLCREWKQVEE